MNARHTPSLESLLERHREGGAFPTYAELSAIAAPAAPSEQARPTVKQLAAQLDDDKPWSRAEQDAFAVFLARFPNESSQGIMSLGDAWKAGRAFEVAATPAAPLPAQPEQNQPQQSDRIAKYALGEWFGARTIEEMQAFYMSRLPAIRVAAKEHGYAIGLHGSTRRDFDLMAMQWRADAADKDTLAHAIAVAACGITRDGAYEWEVKPNGRFAVSMPICWTDHDNPDFHNKLSIGHIDLSVLEHVPAEPSGQHDAIVAARALLESKWDAEGDCGSCAWHACLYEHRVDDEDIAYALQNNGGILELSCVSKDADDPSSHRGVKIKISPDAAEQAQVPAGTAGCSQADFAGSAPLPELTGPSERNSTLEEIALWYADKGWLLDEDDVPAAIRALAASPSLAPAQPTDTEALEMLARVLKYIDPRAVDITLARTGPMEDAYINTIARKCVERLLAKAESAPAPTEPQQTLPLEQAPPNSLPNWSECALRVENSDFTAKRMAEGGYGAEADSKLATQLHRFIFEYDDADSFRSAWFMHRLELTIEEAKRMGGITSKESAESAAEDKQ